MLRMLMKPYASQRTMSALEEEDTPNSYRSVADLTILVSWIMGGMHHYRSKSSAMTKSTGPQASWLRAVLPVCKFHFLSTYRSKTIHTHRLSAFLLCAEHESEPYGYLEGTIEVHATKLQDVNVLNCTYGGVCASMGVSHIIWRRTNGIIIANYL
ncbi:uncharacterized protein BO80DRAFT_217213 [Aspergillus ibericus CBS 121593]|uniref:Uncharacterized protein n=1 Tax=Aspergillus ibericus CBS 121593 TaxID=1448316 RepID=A0A395GRH9_9EURO|nr:hypothetical protein BO80DRAFT_217213 [Aspergillus ibericus CBS 121593]RAK96683.1 hypothetical protein BO80DRAFT_217213 [Aspergillus ibericus CBS 121593]